MEEGCHAGYTKEWGIQMSYDTIHSPRLQQLQLLLSTQEVREKLTRDSNIPPKCFTKHFPWLPLLNRKNI